MLITMSDKEIQRLAVLQDVRDQSITQVRAAEILNLSIHQILGYYISDACQMWPSGSSSP